MLLQGLFTSVGQGESTVFVEKVYYNMLIYYQNILMKKGCINKIYNKLFFEAVDWYQFYRCNNYIVYRHVYNITEKL